MGKFQNSTLNRDSTINRIFRVYLISKPILQWWSEQIKQPITILSQQGSFWHGFGGTHQFSEKDSETN